MAQTDKQTDKQTDGHGDSMTELAQWGRFSENYDFTLFFRVKLKFQMFRSVQNLRLQVFCHCQIMNSLVKTYNLL